MDIICLSSIDWEFNWQGHQQVMSTLAERGHRVLFVENTGVRAPSRRDWSRLVQRLRNRRRGRRGLWAVAPNLAIYSPVILPFPYSPLARRINRALLKRGFAEWLRAGGLDRRVLWTFLPTPLAFDLMQDLSPAVTVYYCVDDLPSSSPAAMRLRRTDAQMLSAADLVFVTSHRLRERALALRGEAHLIPFGVDFEQFQRVRDDLAEPSPELQALPRPVIGYVGGVHRWVDQPLLESAIEDMPDASFVFLGPVQTDVGRLARSANVRFLGPRPHAEVARYIKGFDVGIVPYRLTEYTAHVYPTKLNEYLAMGIPVVATDLPEIRNFNDKHGPVVRIAGDARSFVRELHEALRDDNPAAGSRRIEIARENSWEGRIAQMTTLVEQALSGAEVAAVHG